MRNIYDDIKIYKNLYQEHKRVIKEQY